MKSKIIGIGIGMLSLVILFGAFIMGNYYRTEKALGSIATGDQYFSTTTAPAFVDSSPRVLKAGFGHLGHVIIQGSVAATSFYIVDATTTDITKRASTMSTSSILLASFGASPTLGTYIFDSNFNYGAILTVNGAAGTTTVTWK